ncbi:MAG: alpha/beta fold hydrolase [Rickettsiaceae bacterium]|nr:alpha/beta fold hydrolase [Rickettsiaceae bacterium]
MEGKIFFQNIQELNDKYIEALHLIHQKKFDVNARNYIDILGIKEAYIDAVTDFANNPYKFFEHNLEYASKISKLMFHFLEKMSGNTHLHELRDVDSKDKRFKQPLWKESLYFNFIKQFYLMSSDWHRSLVQKLNVPSHQKRLIEFYTEQILCAASPTNFVNLNPEVLSELIETNGQNLRQGIENFITDIKNSDFLLSVSTTSPDYFAVGENIATTKGKIVMQNDLMQLICYEPKETTYQIPILIIPPWINKYYILDLKAENSFIKYFVDLGFQIYLVSWVNPGPELSEKNFANYLKEGVDEPVKYLKEKFGYKKFNLVGYCIGGTLSACAESYYRSLGESHFESITLITTLLDFSAPGDLALFINEHTVDSIKQELTGNGLLSGKYIAYTFSLLRSKELIWSFVINNYLLGKKPISFDLLYWNADSTNLPSSMVDFYLRNMYLENNLMKNGKIKLLGQQVNLKNIKIPNFFVGTIEDHIVPWQSCFKGYQFINQESDEDNVFCLAGSGHIAGIVNPPSAKKYCYYISNKNEKNPDKWLEGADMKEYSWWEEWHQWIKKRSSIKVKSIDYDTIEYLEFAPGSYVKKRI